MKNNVLEKFLAFSVDAVGQQDFIKSLPVLTMRAIDLFVSESRKNNFKNIKKSLQDPIEFLLIKSVVSGFVLWALENEVDVIEDSVDEVKLGQLLNDLSSENSLKNIFANIPFVTESVLLKNSHQLFNQLLMVDVTVADKPYNEVVGISNELFFAHMVGYLLGSKGVGFV